jgi:hypothetical protein
MNASDLTAEYAEGREDIPESGGRMVPVKKAISPQRTQG